MATRTGRHGEQPEPAGAPRTHTRATVHCRREQAAVRGDKRPDCKTQRTVITHDGKDKQRTRFRRAGGLRQRHQEQECEHHCFRGCGPDIEQVHRGELQPAGQKPPVAEELCRAYLLELRTGGCTQAVGHADGRHSQGIPAAHGHREHAVRHVPSSRQAASPCAYRLQPGG